MFNLTDIFQVEKLFANSNCRNELFSYLDNCEGVDIYTHASPDGDAIGSALGLYFFIKKRGKQVRVFCQGDIPSKFEFMNTEVFSDNVPLTPFDLCFTLDSAELSRLGKNFENFVPSYPVIINIDHHPENPKFGTLNVVDPSAGSTAEIIIELIYDQPLNAEISNALYVAMLSDTYGFSLPNVSFKTLFWSSFLIANHARSSYLWHQLFANDPFNVVQMNSWIISQSKKNNDILLATIPQWIYEHFQTSEEDTEGLANSLLQIADIDTVILFRDRGDSVRLSFRSAGKRDVGSIAKSLGGGGHRLASGANLKASLDQAVNHLLEIITEQE
ncbi:MAG: DHH family phosphoesterase [bacterium]